MSEKELIIEKSDKLTSIIGETKKEKNDKWSLKDMGIMSQ